MRETAGAVLEKGETIATMLALIYESCHCPFVAVGLERVELTPCARPEIEKPNYYRSSKCR